MRQGALIFLGGFFSLACSWAALVLAPVLQLGGLTAHHDQNSGLIYPVNRPGRAHQGAEVYRSLGCNQCHTRFAVQDNLLFSAKLNKASTNKEPVLAALLAIRPEWSEKEASDVFGELPREVLTPGALFPAQRAVELLSKTDSKAELSIHNIGADIVRGWGTRRSVARDYLYDLTMLAGTLRIGPDLANIGERKPSDFVGAWGFSSATNIVEQLAERRQRLLVHLYNPRIYVPASTMPSYPFLFETRAATGIGTENSLKLPVEFAPNDGNVVVPRSDAESLVEWLLSQQASVSLPEAPTPVVNKPVVEADSSSTNAPLTTTQAPAKQ